MVLNVVDFSCLGIPFDLSAGPRRFEYWVSIIQGVVPSWLPKLQCFTLDSLDRNIYEITSITL